MPPFPSLAKPQYSPNLALPIHQLLSPDFRSPAVVRGVDQIIFAEKTEWLKGYVAYSQGAHHLFVRMAGEHFERSPQGKRTKLPLMILTHTKSIFELRLRRLRKLQKEHDQRDNTSFSSGFSFSKSYMAGSSCLYLESRLSQKDLSALSALTSSLLCQFDSRLHYIFNPQHSSDASWGNQEGEGKGKGKGDEGKEGMEEGRGEVLRVRELGETEFGHLMVGQLSINSAAEEQLPHCPQQKQQHSGSGKGSCPSFRPWRQAVPDKILVQVEREKLRYNIGVAARVRSPWLGALPGRKKVREKAEEWLFRLAAS